MLNTRCGAFCICICRLQCVRGGHAQIPHECVERGPCGPLGPCSSVSSDCSFHQHSWAQDPGLHPRCTGPRAHTISPVGSGQGRGFVPCACHSALCEGKWGFCEFSSESAGPLSGPSSPQNSTSALRTGAGWERPDVFPARAENTIHPRNTL